LTEANKRQQCTVITIDGPAGAGKSTVAKELAKRLGFAYLDTGAMYRALTLKALRQKINLENEKQLVDLAHQTLINITTDDKKSLKVVLDAEDVTEPIRSLEVTQSTFYVARIAGVREVMVQRQREIGTKNNIVIEGRDTGTVVFPHATRKFYLDADSKERAQRRIKELKEKGKQVDELTIARDLEERDTKDITRAVGPLKKAEDAIFIDSTGLSIGQVVGKMLEYI